MPTEERDFRLRPRTPRRLRRADEVRVWSAAFKRLLHIVCMSRRRRHKASGSVRVRSYNQRCAVRVTYSTNKMTGQWRAHGRYVARESTVGKGAQKAVGFGPGTEPMDMARMLDVWQRAGDERLFKLIISPEFGDQIDLEAHTRALMAQMERDLNGRLQWVAAVHHNTAHPHVHIALRGVTDRGASLRLDRDYIRQGIRQIAEDLCTAQLGYRTSSDAQEAERREIDQSRYTSLDRLINRSNVSTEQTVTAPAYFTVSIKLNDPSLGAFAKEQRHHLVARLAVLGKMCLSQAVGPDTWRVRRDFEHVLRSMQRATDRQKTLAAHGALISDARLPFQVTPISSVTQLEGRVLGHGEEETAGRRYVLIEGTDAKIHYIYQDNAIETARHRGFMRANSFVRIQKRFDEGGRPALAVEDLGDAEKVLTNVAYMRKCAQRLLKSAVPIDETQWAGWLGRYKAAVAVGAQKLRPFRRGVGRSADRAAE